MDLILKIWMKSWARSKNGTHFTKKRDKPPWLWQIAKSIGICHFAIRSIWWITKNIQCSYWSTVRYINDVFRPLDYPQCQDYIWIQWTKQSINAFGIELLKIITHLKPKWGDSETEFMSSLSWCITYEPSRYRMAAAKHLRFGTDSWEPESRNRIFILGMGFVGHFFAQQLKSQGW